MATSIEVPYNDDLKPLERALAGVRRPGDFFVQGSLEAPMPRIDVRDAGVLSFPIPSAQVAALVAQCERAPYGRGRDTILDTTVRKVWQLAPSRFDIGGKSWPGTFDQVLASVVDALGCADASVSAELYKLLVYDEGAFFKAHRDTEKTEGMFGTLLIVLPSPHAGGQLVMRHAGREVAVDLSGGDVAELKFAAFYADCEHEVLPVTGGNRICLVYNLLQRSPRKGKNPPQLVAPIYEAETATVAELLAKAFTGPDAPTKIAWLLEHQYSPAGLSFAALKSADKARASVLQSAAAHADCAIHLGIVHIEEWGPAEYRSRGSREPWSRRHYHQEKNEDASSEDFEVVEVSDGSSYIDNWRTPEDSNADFGNLPLREGEVLPSGALDDEAPDEQRLLEASGNEGVSFERAYHRAALLLWPRSRFIDVLLQSGVRATLSYLEMRAAAASLDAERQTVLGEARRVIEAWEGRVLERHEDAVASLDFDAQDAEEYLQEDAEEEDWRDTFGEEVDAGPDSKTSADDRSRMLALLHRLADAASLARFIGGIVIAQFRGDEIAMLTRSASLLEPAQCGELFARLVRQRMRAVPRGCMDLFARLAGEYRRTPISPGWEAALREIGAAIVDKLPATPRPPLPHSSRGASATEWRVAHGDTLADLLEVLTALDSRELRSAACAAITANSEAFDPCVVVVSALRVLRDRGAAVIGNEDHERLWLHTADVLLGRSEHPPPTPRDWRQQVKLSCNCADCRELIAFASDPERQTHRFRVRKDRRSHLHRQIEGHGLDMTHVTERQGSPQTLVCIKTRRGYERRCAAYRQDIAALSTLGDLAEASVGEHASRCARIVAARERAARGGKVEGM